MDKHTELLEKISKQLEWVNGWLFVIVLYMALIFFVIA